MKWPALWLGRMAKRRRALLIGLDDTAPRNNRSLFIYRPVTAFPQCASAAFALKRLQIESRRATIAKHFSRSSAKAQIIDTISQIP